MTQSFPLKFRKDKNCCKLWQKFAIIHQKYSWAIFLTLSWQWSVSYRRSVQWFAWQINELVSMWKGPLSWKSSGKPTSQILFFQITRSFSDSPIEADFVTFLAFLWSFNLTPLGFRFSHINIASGDMGTRYSSCIFFDELKMI